MDTHLAIDGENIFVYLRGTRPPPHTPPWQSLLCPPPPHDKYDDKNKE